MTSLQIGLIIGGVVLVVGVLIYNWMQERRMRQKLAAARKPEVDVAANREAARVEPRLGGGRAGGDGAPLARAPAPAVPEPSNIVTEETQVADDFVPPLDFAPPPSGFDDAAPAPRAIAAAASSMALEASPPDSLPQPDPEIESVVVLQPVRPAKAGALAAALHARLGKRLRWFGRGTPDGAWHLLESGTPGEWAEIAACLLLADRAGAATKPLIERFVRLVSEQAAALPAGFAPPDPASEAARAEALDRICADLDVQIGLTVLKPAPATIQGTKLRGVAEAAGFRLADSGRFEWIPDEGGPPLYALTNFKPEPFTAETLRVTTTPGAVFLLDVPRVADPVRVFDQMKLAAKRMTQTLEATLVDDNRRPLNDASLAAIREQVQATAAALKAIRVDPGSPRALALFGG